MERIVLRDVLDEDRDWSQSRVRVMALYQVISPSIGVAFLECSLLEQINSSRFKHRMESFSREKVYFGSYCG